MTYISTGGMPQAINELLTTNDFSPLDQVKRDILNFYHDDFKKLDDKYRLSSSLILDSIASEL